MKIASSAVILLFTTTYLQTSNAGRLNFSKNNDRKLNYTMSTTSTSSSIVEPTKTLFVTYSQTSGGFTTSTSTSQSTSVSGSSTASTKTETVKATTYPVDGTTTSVTTVFPGATTQLISGLKTNKMKDSKKTKKNPIRPSPTSPKGKKAKKSKSPIQAPITATPFKKPSVSPSVAPSTSVAPSVSPSAAPSTSVAPSTSPSTSAAPTGTPV